MSRTLLVAVLALAAAAPARAGSDHDRLVRAIEARYEARHHGVPLLWLAKLLVSDPCLRGLKIAVFEDFPARRASLRDLEDVVRGSVGRGWRPFVSVASGEELTVVYARPRGRGLTLLVATVEDEELTVVQMETEGEALREWVEQPAVRARRDAAPVGVGREHREPAAEAPSP